MSPHSSLLCTIPRGCAHEGCANVAVMGGVCVKGMAQRGNVAVTTDAPMDPSREDFVGGMAREFRRNAATTTVAPT